MGKHPHKPKGYQPGHIPSDQALDERPWKTIEMGLIKKIGPGDLLDMDPDLCDDLEARPEDAGGLEPGR